MVVVAVVAVAVAVAVAAAAAVVVVVVGVGVVGGGTADNAKRPMALGEGGDKCRQVGKCKAEQNVLGDKLETSVKSRGQKPRV